nr:DUF2752 domain-containing protein [Aestuariibaculum marinum]
MNKKLFGMECMGCGMQRSLSLLLHGEFIAAFKMYPAIYTLIPLMGIIFLNFIFKIKYANRIITVLAVLSVIIIILSFIIKQTYH